MIKIEDSLITQALPDCISYTPEVKAIAYAINKQIRKVLMYTEKIIIYPNVDNLNNDILDVLAVELRTHYYSDSFPLSIKRNLIKNYLERYRIAGTKKLVEELVTLIYGEGKITEWFEYNGEPGRFKITVDNTSITNTKSAEFLSLLNAIKRKSAHLDVLELGETTNISIKYGIAYHEVTKTKYL